jgi:hypothetical protein
MGGGTPPLSERGCYFLLTLPPEEPRDPEDEPREGELPREAEPREPPLVLDPDEDLTRAELRPEEDVDPPERTVPVRGE